MTTRTTHDRSASRSEDGSGPTAPEPATTDSVTPVWTGRSAGTPVRIAAAVLLVTVWAVVVGLATPRGPQTTAEAVLSIVVSLAVGTIVGWIWRRRSAILVAPLAFAVVVELVRIDVVGPTVDGVSLSQYGVLALVTGRVVHGLLSLLPLAVGATCGAAAARRSGRSPTGRSRTGGVVGRIGLGAALVALLALVAGLVRPASTAPIVGADGASLPGSVAELTTLDSGGHDLGLMIRGHDVDNPVLLFLAGGPGGAERGAMRNHLAALEEHVTVVTWDQRGTGASYDELDPTNTITLQGVVDDTHAVTEHLLDRFDVDRVLLLGQSWGSTLGVLAVQQRPELYSGFVGTGQMVSQLATDRIMYRDTLAWARRSGREGLVAELERIGEPPYEHMLDYEAALSYEHDVYPYDHRPNAEGEGGFSENLIVQEYSLLDQAHLLAAFVDTFSVLYPQLQDVDFRESATELEVPLFFVQGANEAGGRAEPFADWYEQLQAPIVDLAVLDTAGHRPPWEQPDEFVDYVTETVLPLTARP